MDVYADGRWGDDGKLVYRSFIHTRQKKIEENWEKYIKLGYRKDMGVWDDGVSW